MHGNTKLEGKGKLSLALCFRAVTNLRKYDPTSKSLLVEKDDLSSVKQHMNASFQKEIFEHNEMKMYQKTYHRFVKSKLEEWKWFSEWHNSISLLNAKLDISIILLVNKTTDTVLMEYFVYVFFIGERTLQEQHLSAIALRFQELVIDNTNSDYFSITFVFGNTLSKISSKCVKNFIINH